MPANMHAQASAFLSYKQTEAGLSDLTCATYRRILAEFCSQLTPSKSPSEATERDVNSYLAACWEQGVKAGAVAQRITCLREFYKFLELDKLLVRNPMLRVQSPKQWKTVPRVASEGEMLALISAPIAYAKLGGPRSLRDRAIVETFYATGMRVGELTALTLADLNLGDRVATVLAKARNRAWCPSMGQR